MPPPLLPAIGEAAAQVATGRPAKTFGDLNGW
jgi:hypothetical protein